MPYRLLTQMGLKQHKGEHQVRHDDGMTPDQTITDGAEPNSKLTAKMSVPGHQLPRRLLMRLAAKAPITDKADDWGSGCAMRHPVLREHCQACRGRY